MRGMEAARGGIVVKSAEIEAAAAVVVVVVVAVTAGHVRVRWT